MLVADVSGRGACADDGEDFAPARVNGVGGDFEARLQAGEVPEGFGGEAETVFAEAVEAHACEDEDDPAAGVFELFVAFCCREMRG